MNRSFPARPRMSPAHYIQYGVEYTLVSIESPLIYYRHAFSG